MANYYYVSIKNENVNQELAAKILARFSTSCRVRNFSFCEGCISYNTRGLIDIRDIIKEYGIDEEEVDVVDEFERVEEDAVMPHRQETVERILAIYDDIAEENYNDWECGYWNGIAAALRWALGDKEKDNLDT